MEAATAKGVVRRVQPYAAASPEAAETDSPVSAARERRGAFTAASQWAVTRPAPHVPQPVESKRAWEPVSGWGHAAGHVSACPRYDGARSAASDARDEHRQHVLAAAAAEHVIAAIANR